MATEGLTVSPAMQLIRICLLVLNALFWITGLCLFVIGIWAAVALSKYDDLSSHNYDAVSIVLIVIGLIIACVGFCGCCGALKKHSCLLKTFAIMLAIIVISEVSVAVSGYAYRTKFHCCGNRNYSDWFNVTWNDHFNHTINSVPESCCKIQKSGCNSNNTDPPMKIYRKGCIESITNFFQSKFYVLASGALGVALIQIIAVACAGCFATHIQRKSKYELV